ncbi:MAG: type I restriction endonuclease, partial [bacterium]
MNNLEEVVASVVEKVRKYRQFYEENEQAVRDQIVTPILRSLGWDPENPEEVRPNISTEEGRPDFALLKNGKVVLFLETKKLSVDIDEKEYRQLAKYCFNEGTKYGVLTNGAEWVLVRSFEEGTQLTERSVWKTDLEEEKLPHVVRKLATISKANIEQIEILVKKVQILDEIWQALLKEPEKMIVGLIPVVKLKISHDHPDYQFDDLELEDFLKEKIQELLSPPTGEGTPPNEPGPEHPPHTPRVIRRMKLKGEIFEIRYAYEILVN